MPISADRFEAIDDGDDGPKPGTNAHEILAFLETNPDRAYTQSEIADATGVTRGSIGPTLVRLRDAGRVDHRATYWRASDHTRSLDAALGLASEAAGGREDEPFEYEEWQEYAADPRDDRG